MKKFFLTLGAFMALLSYSVPATSAPGDQVGTTEGFVYPTNIPPCVGTPTKDPKLPKAVPNATWYNTDEPPTKYQSNSRVVVTFLTPEQIESQMSTGNCSGTTFAYEDEGGLHLPNPCKYPKTDAYARLVCHELGHHNGWPAYHGDK